MSNSNSHSYFDVLIIGGGAAGLMCAITAANRGKSVLVLECSNKLGKKILMSGGGRCNFTNLDIQMDNFLSSNPHFFKSALKQYTQWDFITLVAKHGIDYHEKELGQLFCNDSSKQIVNMLNKECDESGVECLLECDVSAVQRESEDSLFKLSTNQGNFECASLVVATGGLSIPTLGGATGFGYKLAEQFGLSVKERLASLVPMTLTGRWHELSQALSGVALPVVASVESQAFASDMLFTHRGISGPAILQLSNYWRLGENINIDFLPSYNLETFTQRLLKTKKSTPSLLLKTYLNNFFPKSFVQVFLNDYLNFHSQKKHRDTDVLQLFKNEELEEIAQHFKQWVITPSGTEGYRTAEVTLGGVDVDYLSSKTMQVNEHEGLFFIGETVDVTAHLGGYNFQWAWSSGYVAGMNV